MALMDLLTMGRSLSEVRDNRHRYKIKSSKLPTFGNPAGPVLEKRFGVGAAVRRGRKAERNVLRMGAKPMRTEGIVEEKDMNAQPGKRWSLKGNPFKSVASEPPRETVQGELSLEKVKPVRNDLTGSDLELTNASCTDREANSVKIESTEVPIVKAQPLLARVLALFQRRN